VRGQGTDRRSAALVSQSAWPAARPVQGIVSAVTQQNRVRRGARRWKSGFASAKGASSLQRQQE